jgi:hypothetical protein
LRNTCSSCCTIYRVKYPIFRHIKCNNSGMAKVKTVKNESLRKLQGCQQPRIRRSFSPIFRPLIDLRYNKRVLRRFQNPDLFGVIYRVKYPIFRHIKCNNSGMAKVKTVKNERDAPLFTGKLLIKFQNILGNT